MNLLSFCWTPQRCQRCTLGSSLETCSETQRYDIMRLHQWWSNYWKRKVPIYIRLNYTVIIRLTNTVSNYCRDCPLVPWDFGNRESGTIFHYRTSGSSQGITVSWYLSHIARFGECARWFLVRFERGNKAKLIPGREILAFTLKTQSGHMRKISIQV